MRPPFLLWGGLVLGLALLGAVAFRGLSVPQARQSDELSRIRKLIRFGDLAAALAEQTALEQRSKSLAALARGWLALANADNKSCALALDHARADGLADTPEFRRLEVCYRVRAEAVAHAEARLVAFIRASTEPEPEACAALARIFLSTYRMPLARETLERWMRDDPDNPTPYVWMTEIDERSSAGPGIAAEHLRAALKRAPDDLKIREKLAETLFKADRYDEAMPLYDALVNEQPENGLLRVGRARTALALGRPEDARADLDLVLSKHPDDATALRERAAIELAGGDAKKSLDFVDRALAVDPFNADAHYRRATALSRLGREDDAATERARATQLREEERALDAIQQQFNKNPGDNGLRCQIARWMLDHGQPAAGLRWLEAAIASDGHHSEANRMLADYYDEHGEPARANFHRLIANEGAREPARTPSNGKRAS